jgi:hypothetical protein
VAQFRSSQVTFPVNVGIGSVGPDCRLEVWGGKGCRIAEGSGALPASGSGLEFHYVPTVNGGTAFMFSWDRTANAGKRLIINASDITLSGTTGIYLGGVTTTVPPAASNQIYKDASGFLKIA